MYKPKNKYELSKLIIKLMFKDLDSDTIDLNDIDTSHITDFSELFSKPIFRGVNFDISKWDVSNATNMWCMFFKCKKFNCDLSKWDVSNVTNMWGMFFECTKFNCDLSKWDVSRVENMANMFAWCNKFNCNLSKWDLSSIKYIGPAPKPGFVRESVGVENMFMGSKIENKKEFWPKIIQRKPELLSPHDNT